MRRRLIGSLVAVAAVIIVVFSVPLVAFVARVERERLVTELERDAFVLAGHAKETLNTAAGAVLPSLEPWVAQHSAQDGSKVVVTNAAGLVVASNDADEPIGTDFANRPEVVSALAGTPAVGERESRTLGDDIVYVAVPVLLGEDVLGVVRMSESRSSIDSAVRSRIAGIVVAGAFTLVAAAAVAVPLAIGLARPIERLRRRTDALAGGDFSSRADDTSGPGEVRELAAAFNQMAARLGSIIEGQRQFAGSVSHQLRTPLTALRLRLEQAEGAVGAAGDAAAVESLAAARAETDRMHEIIEQLLALARLEGASVSVVTTDAAQVVRERAEMWRSLAEEQYVRVEVVAPDAAPCASLPGGLGQIIDNYFDNALSVAPAGSIITLEVTAGSEAVVVDVVDEGPGLSPEERGRAFDRFWRGAATQHRAGTGLGLAIVRQIAVASGGSVELLAAESGGVRARVTLPAR